MAIMTKAAWLLGVFAALLAGGCFNAASGEGAGNDAGRSAGAPGAGDSGTVPFSGPSDGGLVDGGNPLAVDGGPDSGPPPAPDGGGICATDPSMSCASVADCPNSTNFKCDPGSGCCVFFCTRTSDCGGPYDPNDPCTGGNGGCACRGGVCESATCSANADCGGGEVCAAGSCVTPPPPALAASVLVKPNPAVLHVGVPQPFTAAVFDQDGGALVLAPGSLDWSASGNGTIDSSGTFTPTKASTAVGDTTITATVAGTNVAGSAIATIYAAPASGTTLTLFDAATGTPVTGATVEYSDNSGHVVGTPVTSGSPLGVYTLPGSAPAGAALLSVFEKNHQYVSIALAKVATQDLVLFLPQNSVVVTVSGAKVPVVGGFTGDFTRAPGILNPDDGEPPDQQSEVHLGIAGTAVSQDLLDFSLSSFLGPTHVVTIDLGFSSQNVPLPAGVELGNGSQYYQCSYDGLGPAGGCGLPPCSDTVTTGCLNGETDPTQADWQESAFACGARPAWGIGGSVPFQAVLSAFLSGGGGGVDVGKVLGVMLSYVPEFQSGVLFQVPYTLYPPVPANQVVNSCSGQDYPDATPIPDPKKLDGNVTLGLTTPLSLAATLNTPALPEVGGSAQHDLLVLGGAAIPGVGLLPLGLAHGSNVDSNGNPTANGKVCDTADTTGCQPDGQVLLPLAPESGGVEGSPYVAVAVALDLSAAGGGGGGGAISGLVQTFVNGLPHGAANLGASFLPYAQNAAYDATSRTFTNDAVAGASWMRVRFANDAGQEWVVIFDPSVPSFVLPSPGALGDRTLDSDGTTPAAIYVQAVAAAGKITLPQFLDFSNGTGVAAEEPIDDLAGWSSLRLP